MKEPKGYPTTHERKTKKRKQNAQTCQGTVCTAHYSKAFFSVQISSLFKMTQRRALSESVKRGSSGNKLITVPAGWYCQWFAHYQVG